MRLTDFSLHLVPLVPLFLSAVPTANTLHTISFRSDTCHDSQSYLIYDFGNFDFPESSHCQNIGEVPYDDVIECGYYTNWGFAKQGCEDIGGFSWNALYIGEKGHCSIYIGMDCKGAKIDNMMPGCFQGVEGESFKCDWV
ncbi:uncharacterized protein BCR38DRAFT_406038 [Pseudomassariella vexata]|uniref:Uncharacterized protein n=1 Tax=Pseudomassariella vexata TaxID=1141098 RepID=A0A1Y2EFT0_9PEZI|nr:uncharacterized protein BCR38DRAFT_406038 [Pseudomassariella vexata]ORY70431.1 hypothetical protein BCR38DRAFT_406038 [Pseudomassariella vexata]